MYHHLFFCFFLFFNFFQHLNALNRVCFFLSSRIYEILPQRIQQWQQSPCIAEEHGKKQLERIRREQQNARLRLTEMERRFHELEGIIAKAKQQAVQQDEEVSGLDTSLWVLSKSETGLCSCEAFKEEQR